MFFRQKTIDTNMKLRKPFKMLITSLLMTLVFHVSFSIVSDSKWELNNVSESISDSSYSFEAKIQKFLRKQLKGKVKKDFFFA